MNMAMTSEQMREHTINGAVSREQAPEVTDKEESHSEQRPYQPPPSNERSNEMHAAESPGEETEHQLEDAKLPQQHQGETGGLDLKSGAPKTHVAAALDPEGDTRSIETFITDLATAHPNLDLSCLTTQDIKIMMRHKIDLKRNAERFGLVPLAEYNATRRPKPAPRAQTNFSNCYQGTENSAVSRSSAYSGMQNYAAATSTQSSMANPNVSQYGNVQSAIAANWYNAMMSGAYPPEQVQAYFSDMLMKMSQTGQNPMTPNQQWSPPPATSYAVSTSGQLQSAGPVYTSSETASEPYNLKAASTYDSRMSGATTSSMDSSNQSAPAYDSSDKHDVQSHLQQQYASAAHYAATGGSATAGYPQAPIEITPWQQQQQQQSAGNTDMALQYVTQGDDQRGAHPQQHQGYM